MTDFEVLTYKETMTLLKIKSFSSFQKNYLEQGLPTIQVGNSKRIARDDIKKFLDFHKVSK